MKPVPRMPADVPKCARCSQRIADEAHVSLDGDSFHEWCWQILSCQAQIAESRRLIETGYSLLEESERRTSRDSARREPICCVCGKTIDADQPRYATAVESMHPDCVEAFNKRQFSSGGSTAA